jgi:5'-nucleotidase
LKIKSIALGASLLLSSVSASALNIALTNDDGWSTPGIQVLFQALTEAGHNVILAGPSDGQSASSAGFNIGALEITKQAENQFSVALEGGLEGAEPATSGAVAATLIQEITGSLPDLLVSGINDGANISAATVTSGTVGAAIHSIARVLGESVPAIAISTDDRCDEDAGITPKCREVADFVVDYIEHLTQRPNYVNGQSDLIQRQQALNINFPPGEPKGVMVAKQGTVPFLGGSARTLTMGCKEDCNALAVGESSEGGIIAAPSVDGTDFDGSDTNYFLEGYITVVVIQADYTANAKGLKGFLNSFEY